MTSGAQFATLPLNCDQASFFFKKKKSPDRRLLCHWSRQLFDLRAPLSTNLPVLLLNQPMMFEVVKHKALFCFLQKSIAGAIPCSTAGERIYYDL